jgi:hypothetical protein
VEGYVEKPILVGLHQDLATNAVDREVRQNQLLDRRWISGITRLSNEQGNLCLHETAWWGWEDSNFQPNDYQPPALSIEQSGAVS